MLKWYLCIYFFIEYLKCVWKSNCIWIIQKDSKILIIEKKSEDRIPGSKFGPRVGSGNVTCEFNWDLKVFTISNGQGLKW